MQISSSTSSGEQAGCNDQVDLIGFENRGSQTGHGDSGVEADLSALNLHDEDDMGDNFAQELGGEVGGEQYQESIDFAAADHEEGRHASDESPLQTCQKRKGKSTKRKEVMMSFGVVKCDGGGVRQQEQMLKQKNVIKENEDGWRTDNINYFQCQKRPAH